jgi:hypothetical protein
MLVHQQLIKGMILIWVKLSWKFLSVQAVAKSYSKSIAFVCRMREIHLSSSQTNISKAACTWRHQLLLLISWAKMVSIISILDLSLAQWVKAASIATLNYHKMRNHLETRRTCLWLRINQLGTYMRIISSTVFLMKNLNKQYKKLTHLLIWRSSMRSRLWSCKSKSRLQANAPVKGHHKWLDKKNWISN